MERRNFFKKIAGVIAGLMIAPFVIEVKEEWVNRGEFNCQNKKTSYFQGKYIPGDAGVFFDSEKYIKEHKLCDYLNK